MIHVIKKQGSMDLVPCAKFVELTAYNGTGRYQYIVTNKANPLFYKIETPSGAIQYY